LDLANRHSLIERLRKVQQALAIPMLYVTHSPAEALALGSQLFLLDAGRIVAEGAPLDVLSKNHHESAGSNTWEDVRNVFPARTADQAPSTGASLLHLEDGPDLSVPFLDRPSGARVLIAVRADDILLSRQRLPGLSARNQIPGQVERIVRHGLEAEVIVRTGKLSWIVSVVDPAVEQLELVPGAAVHLIIKARSCQILDQ
jgi:molybdate transport system ATP-binding protein